MNNEQVLKFVQKFFNTRLKSKYNIDLTFGDVRRIGNNIVLDVIFPDNTSMSMEEMSTLWDDLYTIKDFVSVLGGDIRSINYNPVFNFNDEDES